MVIAEYNTISRFILLIKRRDISDERRFALWLHFFVYHIFTSILNIPIISIDNFYSFVVTTIDIVVISPCKIVNRRYGCRNQSTDYIDFLLQVMHTEEHIAKFYSEWREKKNKNAPKSPQFFFL